MGRSLFTFCVLAPALAVAAPKDEQFSLVERLAADGTADQSTPTEQFQFDADGTFQAPGAFREPMGATGRTEAKQRVYAVAADGKSAWLATDVALYGYCADCGLAKRPVAQWDHATLLVDLGTSWRPIVSHLAPTMTDADQAKALANGVSLPALPDNVPPPVQAVAELFSASIGDPSAFAKTVSDRKDVVLYGSGLRERYIGGAAVRKQLAAWGLSLKIRDGVQAGSVGSGTVAWIAANVDAVPRKRPKAKPSPYRLTCIYERTGAGWKLVQAHFSFVK